MDLGLKGKVVLCMASAAGLGKGIATEIALHQHGQQGKHKLPQGQAEKVALLVVPDFFVDADFYGYPSFD